MFGRLLEYQSLKAVLQHMDVNARLRISLHMPSIRSVEKAVPLKIDRLFIDDCVTEINDTKYQLGIVRHYPEGNAPEPVKKHILQGGLRHDYDEFGFADKSGDKVLLPGDISFKDENLEEPRIDTEEDEKRHIEDLRIHERALEIFTELREYRLTVDDYVKSLQPIPDDEFMEEKNKIIAALEHPEPLRHRIDIIKLQILLFECRRKNTRLPFTFYIQLTVTKGWTKWIQRVQYTKKLYEATKQLNEVLFGRRIKPIQVRTLDLTRKIDGVCRLPVDLRLQVDKVMDHQNLAIHKNFPLLVDNSGSLDTLWTCSKFDPIGFKNQTVRNAKRLIINIADETILGPILAGVSDLRNPEVCIVLVELPFVYELYIMLIEAWLNDDRQVGASYSINIENEENAEQVLRVVRAFYDDSERTERCVIIHRNNVSKAEVFYEEVCRPDLFPESFIDVVVKVRIVPV